MKKIIQLLIFFFLLIIIYIFYNTYFVSNEITKIDFNKDKDNEKILSSNFNNFIKDLKYETYIDSNSKYSISSSESEITFIDDEELVNMSRVVAIFTNNKGAPIKITSDKASYNINTFRTYFFDNVKIKYLDNTIHSEKIDLDVKNFKAHILDQVKYVGNLGTLNSDNIVLDLITKKIDIYMNNIDDKVTIIAN